MMYKIFVINCLFASSIILNVLAKEKEEVDLQSNDFSNTQLWEINKKLADSSGKPPDSPAQIPKYEDVTTATPFDDRLRVKNKMSASVLPKAADSEKCRNKRTTGRRETNPTVPANDELVKIKGVLEVNSTLERGESLTSKSESVTLTMQEDGNLVLYDKFGRALWQTGTVREGWKAVLQPDGNFVVYSAFGDTVWSSNTYGHPNSKLIVQDDSNIVIYNGDRVIWASSTESCRKPKYKFAPTSGPVEVNLTSSDELFPPFGLEKGQRWEFNTGTLTMQEDGNLVLRNSNNEAIWDSNTQGRGARAVFQEDGNFVIYSDFWRPVWSSGTSPQYNAKLVPQDDGNLFIHAGEEQVWASFTDRVLNPENGVDVLATQSKEVKGTSVLRRGESWSSETANLTMQLDGNLVVYDEFNKPRWDSDTVKRGWRAVFHEDGNFAVYSKRWKSVWSTDTGGHPNATLSVQNDGSVVIYDGCKSIWSTDTDH